MKKRIRLFYLSFIFCMAGLFAENITKIPKADTVSIDTINIVEGNEENNKIYNEKDYPRISKDKILLNRIIFYDTNDNPLLSIDKMEINYILQNNDSNVFLCKQYDDSLNKEKNKSLILFDFKNGVKRLIDVDIFSYSLSDDGNKVYYIKNFNDKEKSTFDFSIYDNKKRKTITKTLDFKDYTDAMYVGFSIKEENKNVSVYIWEDASIIVKLFIDSNCNVTSYALSKYDENVGYSYVVNPDGSKEYFNHLNVSE